MRDLVPVKSGHRCKLILFHLIIKKDTMHFASYPFLLSVNRISINYLHLFYSQYRLEQFEVKQIVNYILLLFLYL